MADQEAEENLNTNPVKKELEEVKEAVVNEFMNNDEIAFIISEDIANDGRVLIISKLSQEGIKKHDDSIKENKEEKSKIIKFNNTNVTCDTLSGGLPMDDSNIKVIPLHLPINELLISETIKSVIQYPFILTDTKTNKLTFEKDGDNAIKCNTSVTVSNGRIYSENDQEFTTPKIITANGETGLLNIPELDGGKPRRKRNKASMKKYKKRKSSTGKKKKIPRRRSRKLRRK